ncbi:MAG: hypothetical protein HC822_20270 [Oscillochloris sp.]|nr:hypothetical protein [Oscillochloris sp.]
MPFNNRTRLDPSQVEDRRGHRGGARVAMGGGGIGLVILLAALLLGVDPSELGIFTESPAAVSSEQSESSTSLEENCRTGADAIAVRTTLEPDPGAHP